MKKVASIVNREKTGIACSLRGLVSEKCFEGYREINNCPEGDVPLESECYKCLYFRTIWRGRLAVGEDI